MGPVMPPPYGMPPNSEGWFWGKKSNLIFRPVGFLAEFRESRVSGSLLTVRSPLPVLPWAGCRPTPGCSCSTHSALLWTLFPSGSSHPQREHPVV